VFVDGDDSVALHLRLNLESLAMFESSVSWNPWEVPDFPLLVLSSMTSPVGSMLIIFVLSSPNVGTESHVSTVVESRGFCVVVDRLNS
jgi:hypothetical protein